MEEKDVQVQASKGGLNLTKVFAAIGIVATISIVILAGVWYFATGKFNDNGSVDNTLIKVGTKSAQLATKSATKSAKSTTQPSN